MKIPGLARLPFKDFLRGIAGAASRENLLDLAAQLAYYGILAVFPFAIFLVSILGYLPVRGIEDEIFRLARSVMPDEASGFFESTVRQVTSQRRGGVLSLSLIGAIVTASGGTSALMSALTSTYEVRESRSWVKRKLIAILMTVITAILIIMAVAGLIVGPDVAERISRWLGLGQLFHLLWTWLRWPAIIFGVTTMLALLYWACPPVRQKFKCLTPGSVVGVPLWIIVSYGFNAYASHLGGYGRTYGALAAAIVLLVWFYLSALIVLFGGLLNAVIWRAAHPGKHEPTPDTR